MARVLRSALIMLGDDPPEIIVIGLSWPALRIRSARQAGATHIVIVASHVTPALVKAIDDARDLGCSMFLARSNEDIGDAFHPDEAVLLISGRKLVDDTAVRVLASAERSTLLCVAPDADPSFELIDAKARWSGFARIDGTLVRSTTTAAATSTADWDLASMLLRRAVGARARRELLESLPLDAAADGASTAASSSIVAAAANAPSSGWGDKWVLRPVARLAALLARNYLSIVARTAPLGGATLILASAPVAWRVPVAALPVLLAGMVVADLGRLAKRATAMTDSISPSSNRVVDLGAAATLATLVFTSSSTIVAAILASVLLAVVVLDRRLAPQPHEPGWLADVGGCAIVIGLGLVAGGTGLVIGLAIAVLHCFATLAWHQNSLSRALTPSQ